MIVRRAHLSKFNMLIYHLIYVLIVWALLPVPIVCPGRTPQHSDHLYCNLVFAKEMSKLRSVDIGAVALAYNIGQSGSLCSTTCMIISRGNINYMDPIMSPDFTICGADTTATLTGFQYCYKGKCLKESDLGYILRKIGTHQNVDV